jgi:putative nucleotidyltransferase with HDIG domain
MARALEALPAYPVHTQARERLLETLAAGSSTVHLAAIVRSDAGLAIAALRAAGGEPGAARAVEVLGAERLATTAQGLPSFDSLPPGDAAAAERIRLHAVAVQRAAEAVLVAVGREEDDAVVTAALLHDVGKLALAESEPGYSLASDLPPLERLERERAAHGVDHTAVGAQLARRWGLTERLAAAIEAHHSPHAAGDPAIVRLADMLAHYEQGAPIDVREVEAAAVAVGIGREAVGVLLYELPYPVRAGRRPEPCPLSLRELTVLRKLSEGKVYKQIASDEGIAASTVRNYLHSAYSKLGVVDRAQAVLMAVDRGWI